MTVINWTGNDASSEIRDNVYNEWNANIITFTKQESGMEPNNQEITMQS